MAFVQAIATGDLVVEPLELEDHARAAAIMERYLDVPLGMVDASVAAVAERLEVTTLLTTDRRHFALIRPAHRPGFLLVP